MNFPTAPIQQIDRGAAGRSLSRFGWAAIVLTSVGFSICAAQDAGDPGFASPAANAACKRYQQAVGSLRQQFSAGLKPAQQAAMRSGDLDEANRLAKLI